jgi:hypothetical protein
MEYKVNFNEICQQVSFVSLLEHLNVPFKIEGPTIKTDEVIITPKKGERDGFKFDLFVWKNKAGMTKVGGSVLDYAQEVLHLKSKTKTAEWLKTNILGQKEQRHDIPNLTLQYDPFLEEMGLSEKICQDYGVGLVTGNSVMAGRICFKLTDHEQKHRGYIGFDHKKVKKILWYVPEGSKTIDMLYNYNRRNGNEYCILVPTPLEALHMFNLGFPYTLSLLNGGMSPERLELMKSFKRVIVISPTATTTALRLSTVCFTKCIETGVMDKTAEQIKSLF